MFSSVAISYLNNFMIDQMLFQTRSIFDMYNTSYLYSGVAYISNCTQIIL